MKEGEYEVKILGIEEQTLIFNYKGRKMKLFAIPNVINYVEKLTVPILGTIKIRVNFKNQSIIDRFEEKRSPRPLPSRKKTKGFEAKKKPLGTKKPEKSQKLKRKITGTYFLPKDTYEVINETKTHPDNYFLSLTKFATIITEEKKDSEEEKFKLFSVNKKKEITNANLPASNSFHNFSDRTKRLCALATEGICFDARVSNALIVGLGEPTVYEVGIRLHFIHGFPYIPSTSIKGAVRSYVIETYFKNDETKALADEGFVAIFGSTSNNPEYKGGKEISGSIIFFDAYPINEPTIIPDFMTVHFRKYYESGGIKIDNNKEIDVFPKDTDSPNPISFLTVKDTSFKFCLKLLREKEIKDTEIEDIKNNGLLKGVAILLKKALTENGIGAKTNVGYGKLQIID